jgi:hypoxanthine phosphoribosyltransferase
MDEFSAAGGMPNVPRGLPGADFSKGSKSIRELSWGEFDRQVQALARSAAKGFKPEAVVGIVNGGIFVGGAVASALAVPFFPVRVTQRSRESARSLRQASSEMPAEIAGLRVLVVDDICASGDSLDFACTLAKARGAKAVRSLTLVSRPGRFQPDYVAFTADDFFVFPWDYQPVVDDGRFETGEHPLPPPARPPKR